MKQVAFLLVFNSTYITAMEGSLCHLKDNRREAQHQMQQEDDEALPTEEDVRLYYGSNNCLLDHANPQKRTQYRCMLGSAVVLFLLLSTYKFYLYGTL